MNLESLVHPQGRYPVVGSADELPAGHGGIEVNATATRRARRRSLAPQIGLDGDAALYGWGRAIVAVPPGEHVVEVQYIESVAARALTVRAGEAVTVTCHSTADRPPRLLSECDSGATPEGRQWPEERRWAVLSRSWPVLRVFAKVGALFAALVAVAVLSSLADVPAWVGMPLTFLLVLPGLVWVFVTEARVRERALAARERPERRVPRPRVPTRARRRLAPAMSADRPARRDDHVPRPLVSREPLPGPPPGYGELVVDARFVSDVELVRDGVVVDERPNYDIWVAPPCLHLDGDATRSGWGTWWYPLRPGRHDIGIVTPATASIRVEVPEGGTVTVDYRCTIRFRKDDRDIAVLGQMAEGTIESAGTVGARQRA